MIFGAAVALAVCDLLFLDAALESDSSGRKLAAMKTSIFNRWRWR